MRDNRARMTEDEYAAYQLRRTQATVPQPRTRKPAAAAPEKTLQRQVEDWLHLHGYWRRSPADIQAAPPPRGWQVHIHQAKRNPILLDVLLLGNDGRYIEAELKRPGGRWSSDEQRILCEHGRHGRFDSFDEFRAAVLRWESEGLKGMQP